MEGGGNTEPIYQHPQFMWVVAIVVVLLLLCWFMSSAENFTMPELPKLNITNPFA